MVTQGALSRGLLKFIHLVQLLLPIFFCWQHGACNDGRNSPLPNWKVWNTLLFVVYLLKYVFKWKTEELLLEPSLEHLCGGAQAPPLEDPALCVELDLSRVGWALGAWSSCCLWAVQWLVCASEVPEHRGEGGGAAERKVSLYFLAKFNASGSSDGDMHPWEVFTTAAGINLPGTRWRGWWLGCFTFPGHKLTTSDPTGILAMSLACSTPAPQYPWPQLALLLLPWGAVLFT